MELGALSGDMGAKSEMGEIIAVHPESWTVDVKTYLTEKEMKGLQIGMPFCSADNGAMFGQMPEIGAIGYVTFPSDGTDPYITNFIMPLSMSESYKGGRPKVNVGDAVIRTTSGNMILVRRGDIIIISAGSGIAQRHYIGGKNTIRDICRTYRMESAGGFMEWGPNSLLLSKLGVSPTSFKIAIKKFEKDIIPLLSIEMGTPKNALPNIILKMALVTQTYKATLDILGNSFEKALTKRIKGILAIILSAPAVHLGGIIATEGVLLGNIFSAIYMEHTHEVIKEGIPTLVPHNVGLVPSAISKKVRVSS